jgi:HAD superfamily hydrolase (TIGR01458 family)
VRRELLINRAVDEKTPNREGELALPDPSGVNDGPSWRLIRGLLVDIDGTLQVAGRPIAGAAEALAALRGRLPFLFTTNTSRMPRSEVAAVLDAMGFDASADEVLTAAMAAALRLQQEGVTRVQLLAPDSVMRDFSAFEITDAAPEAVVVADMGPGFTFEILNAAFRNLLDGARLVAIHRNRYWITEAGPTLDAGPFVAALEVAAQTEAELVGKPEPAFFEMAAATLGVAVDRLAVVGDDPETDVEGARRAGLFAIQVRTGKGETARPRDADLIIDSIRDLPPLLLGAGS